MADELRSDGGQPYLHLERDYEADAQQVWDCWTDPERLARWLGTLGEPLSAGPTRLTLGDGADDWADIAVLRAEEPTLLELRWTFVDGGDSVLRVEISSISAGRTRLTVEHRGLGDSTVGYGAGWQAYLARLAAELRMVEPPAWDAEFAAALPGWRARAQRTSSATG